MVTLRPLHRLTFVLRDVGVIALQTLRQHVRIDRPWQHFGALSPLEVRLLKRLRTILFTIDQVGLLSAIVSDVVQLPRLVPLGDQLPVADADATVAFVFNGDRGFAIHLTTLQSR